MADDQSELLKRPFWYYIKRHKTSVALGLTCLFMTNFLETVIPWLVGKTLDKITSGAPLSDIAGIVGRIVLVILFLSLFRFLWRVLWATFHHTVAKDLRNRLFARLSLLGRSFFQARKIGQLISLISNDTNSFRMGIGPGLLVLLDGVFLMALILPFMISISASWTWQTLALMPLVPVVVNSILKRIHAAYHVRQEKFSELSGSAQEIVSGIRVIKSFAQEKSQTREFNKYSMGFSQACNQVALWDASFGPSLELPVALGSVLLLIIGAPRVMHGDVTLGQFFAFYQYIQRMIYPMSAIGVGLGNIQEGRASFRRIAEVLQTEPDVPDTGKIEIEELNSLEVKDVSFMQQGHTILEDISFSLQRGELLGIVGMTGSGKSTLVDLLTRQSLPTSGEILINGIPIAQITLQSLRQLIGVVPQDAYLFSRKVAENLALGLDLWHIDEVREAAGHVRLDDEIESWPNGYDALVGERGVNLSGGQKQRLTLARALIRKCGLVILDDALSAVDAKTEENILNYLENSGLKRTTSILVTHRLNSVRLANQILVLKDGKIESRGRHEDLMCQSPIYQAIQAMQATQASQAMQGRQATQTLQAKPQAQDAT